jgi:hypothetical protein
VRFGSASLPALPADSAKAIEPPTRALAPLPVPAIDPPARSVITRD